MNIDFIPRKNTFHLIFLFAFVMFVTPQAFATITGPPSYSLNVNPATIDVYCTDATVDLATIVTGNILEIDDSPLFDSVNISTSNLVCDNSITPNKISTSSLTDLLTYYVRLTDSTNDSGNTSFDDGVGFLQPDSNAVTLVLKDMSAGPITIQFRDISITDISVPSIVRPVFTNHTASKPFTITDHNANANLTSKEIITVKIDGVNTFVNETGINTGIFQYNIQAGDKVLYDPRTLGLPRATINIDFSVDPENGLVLVGFAADEKYADVVDGNGLFSPQETVYRDVDSSGDVSDGDIRLVNAGLVGFVDGSSVVGGIGEPDEFFPLVGFAADEKHDDSGVLPGVYDKTENIYRDVTSLGVVSVGDIRLRNIQIPSYPDGSTVLSEALDGKGDLFIEDFPLDSTQLSSCGIGGFTPASHQLNISFSHGGKASSDIDVTMSYADLVDDPSNPNFIDPSILQMYYSSTGPGAFHALVTDQSDLSSHNDTAKTIISNPDFPYGSGQLYNDAYPADTGSPLPMMQGSYALGFENGCGGGGGGGISRSGIVVQAVGALALFGGGSGTSGPPSFDDSVFTLKEDGAKLSGDSISSLSVGKQSDISMEFKMPGGLNNLDHIGLYANIPDGKTKYDTDTFIYFDKFKTPQITIHDPQGFFKSVNIDVTEPTKSTVDVNFVFDFAKSLDNSNVVFEAWNIKRDSALKEIPGLLKVDDPTKSEVSPQSETITPTVTEKPPVPEWIKSNASWWGKGEIDDKEFTNGIGYLIQEKIIDVPGLMQKNTSPEKIITPDTGIEETAAEFSPVVPSWVKNNALWWSEGQLTDDDFIVGIKYLLEKGIIQVKV